MYDFPESSAVDRILVRAEDELRTLIEEGLRTQKYRSIAQLAQIADGVARLRRDSVNANPLTIPARVESDAIPLPQLADVPGAPHGPPTTAARRQVYPRFEREGDRLVKVGWSKKDRRSYEHKAPRVAVDAVVEKLASMGKSFSMDALLPVNSSSGEIPSYQVYVIVAWLRQVGVVAKTARGDYAAAKPGLAPASIQQRWDALDVR